MIYSSRARRSAATRIAWDRRSATLLAVVALIVGLLGVFTTPLAGAAPASASGTALSAAATPPAAGPSGTVRPAAVPPGSVHAAGGGPGGGYWLAGADGGIYAFGTAQFYGSAGGAPINAPVVGLTPTANGLGYWEVAADGGIFAYGNAAFYGSMGGSPLNKPIVGMTSTPDGKGYWLVASDGGLFAFGDAGFYGSTGSLTLDSPIVGMAATPDGQGYWEVAADGGVFAFGDAAFYGSMGGMPLNRPIVGVQSTADGKGYWLVASDGGLFAFGDAGFFGSPASTPLNAPVVGMSASLDGQGYWEVASDGGIFNYGDAGFYGSTGGMSINAPIVAIAPTPNYGTKISSNGIIDISCPTTSWCMAIDSQGNAINYSNGTWGSPVLVDTGTSVYPGPGDLDSVSCPTTTFCMAVDYLNGYSIYNGASWSPMAYASSPTEGTLGEDMQSVSCSSPEYCGVTNFPGGGTEFYINGAWQQPGVTDNQTVSSADGQDARGISCIGTFCMSVDNYDTYQTSVDGVLSPPQTIDPAQDDSSGSFIPTVSCVSSTSCEVAFEEGGQVEWWNGTSFTDQADPSQADSLGGDLNALSCAGTFCAVVNSNQSFTDPDVTNQASSWSGPNTFIPSLPGGGYNSAEAMACPSSSLCQVGTDGGYVYPLAP